MTRKVVFLIAVISATGCASTVQREGAITIITDAAGWDAVNRGFIGTIAETKAAPDSKSSFWDTQVSWLKAVKTEEVK